MAKLIGVAGVARSGKDTVGQILASLGFEVKSVGDEMRNEALRVNSPILCPDGSTKLYSELINTMGYERAKDLIPGVRPYLVMIGDGYRKAYGEDIWLNKALPKDEKITRDTALTSVRYLNEVKRIKELGGEVWLIQRPGFLPANDTEAISLKQIIPDKIIINSGTLEDLSTSVIEALKRYRQ